MRRCRDGLFQYRGSIDVPVLSVDASSSEIFLVASRWQYSLFMHLNSRLLVNTICIFRYESHNSFKTSSVTIYHC